MDNKNEEQVSFSSRFSVKWLLIELAIVLALAASIVAMVKFIQADDDIFSVVFAFVSVGLFIAFCMNYRKAVHEGTVEEGLYFIFVALGKLFTFLLMPIVKLLTKLGFLRGRFGNANDEHSFIFDFGGHGRQKAAKMPKWKNLTDNNQRVRFIFTKHMNYRIKKGYRFKKTLTPVEIEKELQKVLKEDEDISLLFDSYSIARYENSERTMIEDDLVEKLRELY